MNRKQQPQIGQAIVVYFVDGEARVGRFNIVDGIWIVENVYGAPYSWITVRKWYPIK